MAQSNSVASWMDEVKEELCQLSARQTLRWCNIVSKIGVDTATREEWTKTLKEQVESVYEDLIDDALAQEQKLADKIENLLKKAARMCKELGIKLPEFGAIELSLVQEYQALLIKVQEFEEQLEIKKQAIQALNKRHMKLHTLLGKEINDGIPESPLPTDDVLNKFTENLEKLEQERFLKSEIFLETKAAIQEISTQIQYIPNLDLENIILYKDDCSFILSDYNMEFLSQFLTRLNNLKETLVEEIATGTEKLKLLWNMLDTDVVTTSAFLDKHSAITIKNLDAIKNEVLELEKLKKCNIEKFVKSLRNEIEKYWDLCHYSPDQRNEFEYFNTECYTEDLLTLHDLEIHKLKKYYNENCELFCLIEKRNRMWNKLKELDERCCAPDRFKNRGGLLLKEEKERNALSKNIPSIEQQLMEVATNFEIKLGKQFTSWGRTLETIITADHKLLEEEKSLKSATRKKDKTLTPGKSTLSRAQSHQNLLSVACSTTPSKRKLALNFEGSTKRTKRGDDQAPTTAPPEIYINDNKQETYLLTDNRTQSHRQFKLNEKRGKKVDSSEYDIFMREIDNKENCRSTLFGENINPNDSISDLYPLPKTPVRAKTPVRPKTPTNHNAENATPGTPGTVSKLTAMPSLRMHF